MFKKSESLQLALGHLDSSIQYLQSAITSTPSGDSRNSLTDAHIIMLVARDNMMYDLGIALFNEQHPPRVAGHRHEAVLRPAARAGVV